MIKIGINKISDLEYPNELDIKAVLPIVQDRENYKISIEKLLQYIGGGSSGGLLNISRINDNYNYLTPQDAYEDVQQKDKIRGQVLTYRLSNGKWNIDEFIGDDINQWTNLNNWERLSTINDLNNIKLEDYINVYQTNSIFDIDHSITPYSSIYLDGNNTIHTINITNLNEGETGKILVKQKGDKKISLTNTIAYIDLPTTVDSMILITYFKTNDIVYASSSIINLTGQQLAPDTITDLTVIYYDANSIKLQWSAPNGIDLGQSVTMYDMRYSNNEINPNDLTQWNSIKRVKDLPIPAEPGNLEYFNISNLDPNKEYFIYIRSTVNYKGINYTSAISNAAYCKTQSSESSNKAYRISFSKDQIFTVSDQINTDGSTIWANPIHLKGEMIDEENSNNFLENGYPDTTQKAFITYHVPYKYSRMIRPYYIYIDLYNEYYMDKIYSYSTEKFDSTVYGIRNIGYPIEEIGRLGNRDSYALYDNLDFQNKRYRYIIISQDKFNCIAGVQDDSQYSSAMAINNLLLFGRPATDVPEKIHEPLRRSVQMRPVDEWFNVNGHIYQSPDIHAISGGPYTRLYANYNRWTAWDGLHNYDSVANFKYTLNTNPWIKNNNYKKVSPDTLMLQYKALGLKPFLCTFDAIKQCEYEGLGLKNLDDYWYPNHWRPQCEDGVGGMERYFEKSKDPNQYRVISRLHYHLASRYGNNTEIDPNTLNLEPSFSGNNESNNIGLGVLYGLEVENELDAGRRLKYHDPLEYGAMCTATLDGNGDSLQDENGNKWFGIKKADPSLLRILPGIANNRESYVYLGYLAMMGLSPTKEVNFDVINTHWYSSSNIPRDNASWSKSAFGVPLDIEPLSNDFDPERKELNLWNFRDKHLPNKELWITEFGYGESGQEGMQCKYQAFNMPGKILGNWQIPDRHRSDIKGAWIIRTAIYFMSIGVNLANYYSTENEGNWYSIGTWGTGQGNEFHVWDHMNPEDYPNPGDRYNAILSSVAPGNRNGFNTFGLFGSLLTNGAYPITHSFWWTATFRNRLKNYVFKGFKVDPNQPKLAIACFKHKTQDKSCYVIWYKDMINHGIENYPIKFPDGTTNIKHVTTYIPIIPDATKVPIEELYNPGPEWYPIIGPVGAVYDVDVASSPTASQRKVWNDELSKYELDGNLDRSWEQVNAVVDYVKNSPEGQKGTSGIETDINIIAATYTTNISEFPEYYFFDGQVDPTFISKVTDLTAKPTGKNTIKLYWNNSNPLDESYEIFISNSLETGYSKFTEVIAGIKNETTISGLTPNTVYYFKVRSKKGDQFSDFSEYSSAKTYETVTDPYNLRNGNRTSSTIELFWDWDIYSNPTFSFYAYYIYRSPNDGNFVKIADIFNKNIKTYTDSNLNSGTIYTYRVIVIGDNGNSNNSNILETRTLLPTESAPLLMNAETDKYGSKLILTFDLPLQNPEQSDVYNFILTENSNERVILDAAIDHDNNNRLFLYVPDDTLSDYDKKLPLRLSYNKPSSGGIKSAYGTQLESFNNFLINNNIGNFTNLYATYQVNLSGPDTNPITQDANLWNDIKLNPSTNITSSYLKDTLERVSPIRLNTINQSNPSGTSYRWGGIIKDNGSYNGELTSDTAITKVGWTTVYQAQSTENYLARFSLSGLTYGRKYTIKMFGGVMFGTSTSFSIRHNGINSATIPMQNNSNTFAILENMLPDSNGNIIIDIKNHIDPPLYAYAPIQFFILEEYLPGDVDNNTLWIHNISCNEVDELNRVDDRNITISANIIGTPTHYMISEISDFSNSDWVSFTDPIPYLLSEGFGDKEIYLKVKNNYYTSNVRVLKINYYDNYQVLTLNGLYINNDSSKTTDPNVTVKFSYVGKPTHYKISNVYANIATMDWIEWTGNNISHEIESAESGMKFVYGVLKDSINATEVLGDSIEYEKTVPPIITSSDYILNYNLESTNSIRVRLDADYKENATHYCVVDDSTLVDNWIEIKPIGNQGNPIGSSQDPNPLDYYDWGGFALSRKLKLNVKQESSSSVQVYETYSRMINGTLTELLGTNTIDPGNTESVFTITNPLSQDYAFIKNVNSGRIKMIITSELENSVDFTNLDDSFKYHRLSVYHLIPNVEGDVNVGIKFKNTYGQSALVSKIINYTAPELNIASLVINNGDTSTENPVLNIKIMYEGFATKYMISESSTFVGAEWNNLSDNLTYNLNPDSFGVKTLYVKLKNDLVETSYVSSSIVYNDTRVKVGIGFLPSNDYTKYNKIFYDNTSVSGITNVLVPFTNSSYTRKQLQNTKGELVPWYYELTENQYPITENYLSAGSRVRWLNGAGPLGLTQLPYAYMDNVYSTGTGTDDNWSRFILSLPVGSYMMKLFYSRNAQVIPEARREHIWYRLDVNGVHGTPINQFPSGFNTQNNDQWTAEIEFNITSGTQSNVVLHSYYDKGFNMNAGDPGVNFIEITKLD